MEKIYFCVTQIVMTQNLLNVIKADFFGRVISRKIIIRIKDFIELTRIYNNTNIENKQLRKELKRKLNKLENNFNKSLKLQRHKLSAHFQDLDFFNRTKIWSDITKEQIDTFTTEIIDSYTLLKNQHDYIELMENNFILEHKEIENISLILEEKDIECSLNFSSDILSITRSNASAIIPCHPTQDKVMTLNSINLMIDFEIALYKAIQTDIYKQLLKTIIINDLVSFIDNFITRENSKYIGLDKIIDLQINPWKNVVFAVDKKVDKIFLFKKFNIYKYRPDTESPKARIILDEFLELFNKDNLTVIVFIRKKLGSHIDKKMPLNEIIKKLDLIEFDKIENIYLLFYNLFKKMCKSISYLQHFVMPVSKIRGFSSIENQPKNNFYSDTNYPTIFKTDDVNDKKLYSKYLMDLINNNKDEEDIIFFMREALKKSDVVKIINFEDNEIKITKCQEFFFDELKTNIDTNKKRALLYLLEQCSLIDSKSINYILIETYKDNISILNYEYIRCFGNVIYTDNEVVFNILMNNLKFYNDFHINYQVVLSLIKIYTNIYGSLLVNKRQEPSENKYSKSIKNFISGSSNQLYKLIFIVLLKSEFMFTNHFTLYRDYFKELFLDYFQQVFFKNIKTIKLNKRLEPKEKNLLKQFYINNKLSNIIILLAEKCNSKNKKVIYQIMVNLFSFYNKNLDSVEHYAYANYKIGNIKMSITIYKNLINENPENIYYRFSLIEYYIEEKNFKASNKEISLIEETFNIKEIEKKYLEKLKNKIE